MKKTIINSEINELIRQTPEYKHLIFIHPYFDDFLDAYDDVYNLYKYPVTTAPLSWFVYWFMKRSQFFDYIISWDDDETILLGFKREHNRLTLYYNDRGDPEEFVEHTFEVNTFSSLCVDLDNGWGGFLPALFWDEVLVDPQRVNYRNLLDNYINENIMEGGLKIFKDEIFYLRLPDCDLVNKRQIFWNLKRNDNTEQPSWLILITNNLVNKSPNFEAQWIIKSNIPFAVLVHKITYKVRWDEIDKIGIGLEIKILIIHRSLYDSFVVYHLDLIEGYRGENWKLNDFQQYAAEYWGITDIENREQLYKNIKGIINSGKWRHKLDFS